MPVASGDGQASSSPKKTTKKKVTRVVKPPVYGPVAPVVGPVQSTKSVSSHPTQPTVSKPPSYAKPPTRKAPKVVDKEAFKATPSLGDTLSQAKESVKAKPIIGPWDHTYRSENFPKYEPPVETNPLIPQGEVETEDNSLENFLKKIQPQRPENYDPSYGGLTMPERLKHRRGDKNAPLRMHWDEDYIKAALAEHEGGYESDSIKELNGILYKQLEQQQDWIQRRTEGRAYKLGETLSDANEDAKEGEFGTLGKELEDNPDLLEFNAYAKDFTTNSDKIWREWKEERKGITDPYTRKALSDRVDMYMDHYDNIRKYYNSARKVANRALETYEEKYNDSVEYNDAEDTAGPAIPDVAGEAAKEEAKNHKITDLVGEFGDDRATWAEAYGGKEARAVVIKRQRKAIRNRLGVKDLPTVREMLAVKVSSGELDPEDEAAVAAWVDRLKNPNHPDTRAMYYGFARTANKKLDDEKDGLPFINGPTKRYIKSEEKRAEDAAEYANRLSTGEYDDKHQEGFLDTAGDIVKGYGKELSRGLAAPFAGTKNLVTGDDRSLAGVTGKKNFDDPNGTGALGWTIDKLMRANYAVAGAVDSWNSLDRDPAKASSWVENMVELSNPINWFGIATGHDPLESVDEAFADPKKLGKAPKEAYNQFFQGSDLPGVRDDVVPTTFAKVIANNGLRDPEDNIYDESWYHHTAGFFMDAGTDPLNFVGVGIVNDALKLPKGVMKAARDMDNGEELMDAAKFSDILEDSVTRGPAADRAFHAQQALSKAGDESPYGVPTVADTKLIPFRFTVEKVEGFKSRSDIAPAVSIPRFHEGFDVTRKALEEEFKELDQLRKFHPQNIAMEHYVAEFDALANDMAFAPVRLPEVRANVLAQKTAIRFKLDKNSEVNYTNAGGKLWQRIIKPLTDQDVVRNWEGAKSETKFAEFTDAQGTRLTTKAARAKAAMEAESKHLDSADYFGVSPDISPNLREGWQRDIEQGYDIDEATGKPSVWEEYNVDEYIDAGAPGLLSDDWDIVADFASAAGIPREEFAKQFSQTDIIKALWHGPRMLEAQDANAAARIMEARTRIKDSKQKIKSSTKPSVKNAAAKSLALAYEMSSAHTIEGAFRMLDTLQNARRSVAGPVEQLPQVTHLDDIIMQANSKLDESYGEVDDMSDYLGGFEGTESALPIRNGTYSNFDFTDKNVTDALEQYGVENFTSKSAQLEAIIAEATKQRTEIIRKAEKGVNITALDPAQAYEVEKLLPPNSIYRNKDGSIDTEALGRAFKFDSKELKVTYTKPAKPRVGRGQTQEQLERSAAWAHWQRETAFLDNLRGFLQDRANTLFREEKTHLLRSKWEKQSPTTKVPQYTDPDGTINIQSLGKLLNVQHGKHREGDSVDILDDFYRNGKGPAERALGAPKTAEELYKNAPNYFGKKLDRAEDSTEIQLAQDLDLTPEFKADRDALNAKYDKELEEVERRYLLGQTPGTKRSKGRITEKEYQNFMERRQARYDADLNKLATKHDLKRASTPSSSSVAKTSTYNKETGLTHMGSVTSVGRRSKGQKEVLGEAEKVRKGHARAVQRARELDAAEYARLAKEREAFFKAADNHKLEPDELKSVYGNAFKRALEEAGDDLNRGIIRQTPSNARLPVGDQSKILQKQLDQELQYKVLQNRMDKLEATSTAEFRAIEARRKELVKQRIQMYGRTKKIKMEANITHKIMVNRVAEEQVIQAMTAPARMTGRMVQLRIMGMKKNLQFSGAMFDGAEHAAKLVPEIIRSKFIDTFARPTKQLSREVQREGILLRARHESKTPVVIKAHLENLNKVMHNIPDTARTDMLRALENNLPYGGKYKSQFEGFKDHMDDIMRIFNGSHDHYMFNVPGKNQAKALSIDEIFRFMPETHKISPDILYKVRARRISEETEVRQVKQATDRTDPFSPLPEARDNFTIGDVMEALRLGVGHRVKDLDDPFRLSWVVTLAADQAAQSKRIRSAIGETFGVARPQDMNKVRIWNKLSTKHDWAEFKEMPGYLFPPEVRKDMETMLKFLEPGPEHAALTRMFDQAMGYWKQGMTIYNPAYYTRNGVGEMMVSALDGLTNPKWYRMAYRANKYLKGTDTDLAELVAKFDALEGTIPVDVAKASEKLFKLKGGMDVRIEDLLYWYTHTGMKSTFANTDIGKGVRALANESLTSNPVRKKAAGINNAIHDKGEGFEDWLRMAHFAYAMADSGKGTLKEAAEEAARRVARSHFDYTDFSKFEKAAMLRAFPFYKWIRRGAPLMVAHLFMTPGKMAALPKALNTASNIGIDPLNAFNDDPVLSTNDIHDDKNGHLPNYSGIAPAWVRDLFAYAMQPAEDDEYANYFRMTTPQIDGLSGAVNFAQNYDEKGLVGGLADTTAYPLLNPLIKSGVELGRNKGLDPDFAHEIYGGDYNESRGVSDPEAIGSYAARQTSPHLAFLSKLSNRGKLPDALNVTDDDYEHPSDAMRDVVSFFTGAGFYQGRQEEFPVSKANTELESSDVSIPAVGLYDKSEIPQITGLAGHETSKSTAPSSEKGADLNGFLGGLAKTGKSTKGSTTTSSSKGRWVDYPEGRKWVDYPKRGRRGSSGYGGYSSGPSGSSGSSSGFDLLALLRKLRDMVDQGDVIDPNKFRQE